jgi:hypothetical protein
LLLGEQEKKELSSISELQQIEMLLQQLEFELYELQLEIKSKPQPLYQR